MTNAQRRAADLVCQILGTEDDTSEQEKALIALLVQTEDLSAELAKTAYVEYESFEHGCVDIFHAGGISRCLSNGTVDHYPN